MTANIYYSNNNYVKINNYKIYLDKQNQRVKIIDINDISADILDSIIDFSKIQKVGKIICICKESQSDNFIKSGFESEGKIEGFFNGENGLYMSFFIDNVRKKSNDLDKKELILKQCMEVKNSYNLITVNFDYIVRTATENDIEGMINLFTSVFSTYPSPVYDEDYLKQTMNSNILYKVAVLNDEVIGIASADMDKENLNAEITDCATNPDYRGKGILSNIINSLEQELKSNGYKTLYSIARAINPGINIALSKQSYDYSGRLINNCNICSSFEDMNIWVKNIN